MTRHRTLTLTAALGLAAATLPFAGGAAVAGTPSETGCPTAYTMLSVSDLEPQGYHLPTVLDEQGNNDGYVCGKPFAAAAAEQLCGGVCGVAVVFNFSDNHRTRR